MSNEKNRLDHEARTEAYVTPTLTHHGSIEARTLGQHLGDEDDTGEICPYCWKDEAN